MGVLEQRLRTRLSAKLYLSVATAAKCNKICQLVGGFIITVELSVRDYMVNAIMPWLKFAYITMTKLAFVPISHHCKTLLSTPISTTIFYGSAAIIDITRAALSFTHSCMKTIAGAIAAGSFFDKKFTYCIFLTALFTFKSYVTFRFALISPSAFNRAIDTITVSPVLKFLLTIRASMSRSLGFISCTAVAVLKRTLSRTIFRRVFCIQKWRTAPVAFSDSPFRLAPTQPTAIDFIRVLLFKEFMTADRARRHINTSFVFARYDVVGNAVTSSAPSGATLAHKINYTIFGTGLPELSVA